MYQKCCQRYCNYLIQWNLDLVTLLVSRKTVTKSRFVTKFIANAYGVSIKLKFFGDQKYNLFLVCVSKTLSTLFSNVLIIKFEFNDHKCSYHKFYTCMASFLRKRGPEFLQKSNYKCLYGFFPS